MAKKTDNSSMAIVAIVAVVAIVVLIMNSGGGLVIQQLT